MNHCFSDLKFINLKHTSNTHSHSILFQIVNNSEVINYVKNINLKIYTILGYISSLIIIRISETI